jgi:hypothetical protein
MRRAHLFSLWLPLAASLLIIFGSGSALAQSGRRQKEAPSPAPSPEAEKPQAPAAPKPTPQPQISLLVVTDISQSLYLSIPFPEKVQTWVTQRLRDSAALSVAVGESLNRSEAVKRAKASKETFVVFIKVDQMNNTASAARAGRANMDDVSISFSVFAPVTGKSRYSGTVYLSERGGLARIGRVRRVPVCYPGVRGDELLLLEASLEVASRVMASFNVTAPPICTS